MSRTYNAYVTTNWNNKVMYIGMTNDLNRCAHEHKNKLVREFTYKYNTNKLVYFEQADDVSAALVREGALVREREQCAGSVT